MHSLAEKTGHGISRKIKPHEINGPDSRTTSYLSGQSLNIFRKSSCPCGGGCPSCQSSNLNISQPNDPAEIEADAIADKVMRMPAENSKPIAPVSNSSPAIHRKCDACADEEEEKIQRKALPSSGGIPSQSPAHVQSAISSGGRPLDANTRSFFEPRMGYDLGSVRIHTGSTAGQSARSINAKAYTLGSNIVFGNGEYKPESESGRHLIAHELAHVGQSAAGKINRQTIYRQPEKRICVPGMPADDPACVEWAKKKEELDAEARKPGTTITVTGPDTPMPAGVGLRVPAHPDALSGIHSWSDNYAVPNSVPTSKNKFTIGTFTALQLCQYDTSGSQAVYVYYVYDNASSKKYAVGADSIVRFASEHGGVIVARGANTDTLAGGIPMFDPRKLPAAPDAFDEDPQMYYVAPKLPAYNKESDAFVISDYYHMRAYLRQRPDGSYAVLYYVAQNLHSDLRPEYVVGPKWLDFFIKNLDMYAGVAAFSYPIQKGAMPAAYQAQSARYVMGVMKGDPERASSGLEAWKSAAKDPSWWLQVGMGYAGAAQPAPRVTGPPNLSVIKGGGITAAEPIVNTGSTVSTSFVGRGGAAPAIAAETAVASTPVPAPRPGPVGVPGWNPNPAPLAAPPQPISPLASSLSIGAASKLSPGALPRPDVDMDLDKEKKRGKCTYQSIGQQFGRYPCHAAYATSLSGVSREVRVTSPTGESVDFDAMDHGQTLYEVKTGYRWLVFMGDPVRVNEIAARFWGQAVMQMLVAAECGHPLKWYFNDPYVASFFGAENSPYPAYFRAPMPVPVWYSQFNCNVDSDG